MELLEQTRKVTKTSDERLRGNLVLAGYREEDIASFLGRSAAGRRMTAKDELQQLSGSGHSSTLALRKTSS